MSLNIEQATSVARAFGAQPIELDQTSIEKLNLPQVVLPGRFFLAIIDFVELEKDEARNIDPFLERFRAFARALPNIAWEGGTEKERELLIAESQRAQDENVLAILVSELRTIVDDLTSQTRGSSRQVDGLGRAGFDVPEDQQEHTEPPPDSDAQSTPNPDKKSGPGRAGESGDSTWRSSINDSDLNSAPKSDEWRQSLNESGDSFSEGDGDGWKASINLEDAFNDDLISREAETEFDRLTSGDGANYHRNLASRLTLAKEFEQHARALLKSFNEVTRPAVLQSLT